MLKDNTHQLQSTLAQYCRDGNRVALPVDSDARMAQYRRLVFNVIKGTLEQAYPITVKFLESTAWSKLVEDFFSSHQCQNPQVWQMPRELIDFVGETKYDQTLNLPHLVDLLRMEWLEIAVHTMPDQESELFTAVNDILNEPLVFNPHHQLERFDYPVHKIHQLEPQGHKGEYFLLAFREEDSGRVQFIHLQPFYAILLDSIIQNPGSTATEIGEALCKSVQSTARQQSLQELKPLLNHLYDKTFILGKAIL